MTTYSLPLAFTMILDMVRLAEGRWAFVSHPLSVFSSYKISQLAYKPRTVYLNREFRPFSDSAVTITFFRAGHMFGAAGILIRGEEGSIFYTGDFSLEGGHTFGGADFPSFPSERVDVLITETTYGNQNHPNKEIELRRLAKLVTDTISRDGSVLIPTPALSKAQELLLTLLQLQRERMIPHDVPIFVDGLVRTICDHYEKMIRPKMFFQEDSPATLFRVDNEEARKYLLADSPCVVVASSGQLVGGPSVSYAMELLPDPSNAIIFASYLDRESPAGKIVNTQRGGLAVLDGREVRVNAGIENLVLSAHADQKQLLSLALALKPKGIVVVHGEREARLGFQRALGETGYPGKVFAPEMLEVVNLA